MAKQTKRLASERMKFGHEVAREKEALAKEKETLAAQRAEFEAWKAEHADRRRNPAKYLARDYGDDWYDKLSQVKLTGAPTTDLIASELDEREARIKKEFEEREKRFEERLKERDAQEAQRHKQQYEAEALEYVQKSADSYPLIHAAGLAKNITAVIENHYIQTSKRLDDGRLEPGELWTPEQAAKAMESELESIVEKALKAKQAKEAPKAAPKTPERIQEPQRRTLSTDIAQTSQGEWTPPRNESERLRRAVAAWESAQAIRH